MKAFFFSTTLHNEQVEKRGDKKMTKSVEISEMNTETSYEKCFRYRVADNSGNEVIKKV